MKVVVHGGAGSKPENPDERKRVLDSAASRGVEKDSVVDAVEESIRVLEDSSYFNAGRGGAVQSDGEIRTDAGIMTDNLIAGAVCSMPRVQNAVRVARVVMERTPHVLVSGKGAIELAEEFGIDTEADLWTEETKKRWDREEKEGLSTHDEIEWANRKFGGKDTVGAVAWDNTENPCRTAAATSTGGRWFAFKGRVGDVPQVGSGFYACPGGGVSATGAGEDIARVNLSSRVAKYMEEGVGPQEAVDKGIRLLERRTGAKAGVIAMNIDGDVGIAYNTEEMQTAVSESDT